MSIGLLCVQHFLPQRESAIAPAANRLTPKTRVKATQIAFDMKNPIPVAFLFIVF
jgi:hypothetical protein